MESTIKIALGDSNEPVIKMTAVSGDDIRDQLCTQWIQGLQGSSNLAHVTFGEDFISIGNRARRAISIIPLPPKSHFINHMIIEKTYDAMYQKYPYVAMLTGGDSISFENTRTLTHSETLMRDKLIELNIIELVEKIKNVIEEIAKLNS